MAKVLQKQNQVILWNEDFLFLEWKIEISDAVNSFPIYLDFMSLSFNLGDIELSYFKFVWLGEEATSRFYFNNAYGLRSRNARIVISNSMKSVIRDVDTSTDDLYDINNLMAVILDTPSLENFPLTITGIISNSTIIPRYQQQQPTEKHTTTDESYSTYSMTCLTELSEDFKKILDSKIYFDIALKVEDVSIKAHKMVLHARSPVFQKMLNHDTTETAENTIAISDISAAVMKKLVAYLYTGEKEKCSFEESCELYYAADKYEVLSLREACRVELLTLLQVDNAGSLFNLANRHSDEEFAKEVVQFMNANFESVVETKSFNDLDKDDMMFLVQSYTRSKTK